jgi:ribosome-binding ATPase
VFTSRRSPQAGGEHRWNALLEAGSEAKAQAKGALRPEGKGYLVQDGDVVHIRHSG